MDAGCRLSSNCAHRGERGRAGGETYLERADAEADDPVQECALSEWGKVSRKGGQRRLKGRSRRTGTKESALSLSLSYPFPLVWSDSRTTCYQL